MPTAAPAALILDRALRRRILAHLLAALPHEGCGLLATVPAGEDERAVRFYPGTNLDASPVRYTMDPAEVLAALRDIEGHGWRLGAIVHSHPATPPTPSATDLREARYPGALLLIVSFGGVAPAMRAWRGAADTGAAVAETPILLPAAESR
jgi:proteasome lid subunit RPN8/RPN11